MAASAAAARLAGHGPLMSPAKSSGADQMTSTSAPVAERASSTTCCISGWQMNAVGSQSPIRWASSLPRSIGLTGTTIAPSFQVASKQSTNAGVFCSEIATRSPCHTPKSASPRATTSLSRSTSTRLRSRPK